MMGERDDGGETEENSQRDCIYTCHFAPVPKSCGDVIVQFRTGYIATRTVILESFYLTPQATPSFLPIYPLALLCERTEFHTIHSSASGYPECLFFKHCCMLSLLWCLALINDDSVIYSTPLGVLGPPVSPLSSCFGFARWAYLRNKEQEGEK